MRLYHGWLVGVPIDNPASVTAWAAATAAGTYGGAIWGVGGVASDGKNPFVTTGNTFNTGGNWGGGEAVIRFQPGPIFSGSPADYWAPTNWQSISINATRIWVAPVHCWWTCPAQLLPTLWLRWVRTAMRIWLIATTLVVSAAPVASAHVGGSSIIQAAATYRTEQGTYVAFRANNDANLSRFPHYCDQSAHHRQRMEREPGQGAVAARPLSPLLTALTT